jgi:predicted DNA-binding transcriptional regulator AlpA
MRNDEPASHRALPVTGYLRQTDLVGDRKRNVRGIIPFSPATLWRKVKAGEFPEPVKLSVGVTAWRVEDIRAWMDSKR